MNEKPTILGFKPTDDDWVLYKEIKSYLEDRNITGKLTNADVFKYVLSDFHRRLKGDI